MAQPFWNFGIVRKKEVQLQLQFKQKYMKECNGATENHESVHLLGTANG